MAVMHVYGQNGLWPSWYRLLATRLAANSAKDVTVRRYMQLSEVNLLLVCSKLTLFIIAVDQRAVESTSSFVVYKISVSHDHLGFSHTRTPLKSLH